MELIGLIMALKQFSVRSSIRRLICHCGLIVLTFFIADKAMADTVEAERFYQRGKSAYTAGKVAEAMELFTKAIKEDEKHVPSYLARGYMHQYDRNYREAANDFSKAIEIAPDNPESWFRRAVENFNLGEFAK